MRKHIMIDIETLGKKDDAVILSAGAVSFDGKEVKEEFYKEFCVQSQLDIGRTIDGDTLNWWSQQGGKPPIINDGLLLNALLGFRNFITAMSFSEPNDEEYTYIWAHGVTFDITKLQSILPSPPWQHWQIMDCRTLVQLWPECRKIDKADVKHHALDDARSQAGWLIELNKKLNFL